MLHRTIRVFGALAMAGATTALLAVPAGAQSTALDRLSIHGFLTQAYGVTDGHQLLGIPSFGTADYRVAALQFRYDASDRDAFVVQLSHERLGRSPLASAEPDVALDWVFYEHGFGDNTIVRVGKIRTPTGIYNEVRDVGTLLPLYRPPVALYGEQMYTSETLDGVMVGHRQPLGDWTLDLRAFAGSWEFLQLDFETYAKVDGGLGGQLWVETPLQGLRVGGGALTFRVRNLAFAPPELRDDEKIWLAALDGTFTRFFVRGEYFHVTWGEEQLGWSGTSEGYYGQAGLHLTDAVTLVGQAEFSDFAMNLRDPFPFTWDGNFTRDLALGLRYQPMPHLALKLEGHAFRGYPIEDELRFLGIDDPARVGYALFSVSTSF